MAISLGELEQLVILAVLNLGDEAYGVPVRNLLEQRTRRRVSAATVYTTLMRLEDKGLVRSRLGEPTAVRGGRRKKHYSVTAPGRRALSQALGAIRKMSQGLNLAADTA